jgi:PEP-CTERM motif
MNTLKLMAVSAALVTLTGAAQAAPLFQGRQADGTASATCTVSGAAKCAMFYNTTLDITILNDWNIGSGIWSATAAAGSAQALAASAGAAQTAFTGWFLPTGDGGSVAGALNQYLSLWSDVGGSLAGLQAQFDGVQSSSIYWSGTGNAAGNTAWDFGPGNGFQSNNNQNAPFFAVAVRSGDVAASVPAVSVPEPQTVALALLALGAAVVVRRTQQAG